jgi:large subunit ribosomal protein L22
MRAILRSARIAPKKANIVAMMVRGMPVSEAIDLLGRTHKKAARLIEKLLASAAANARHNFKQDSGELVVRTIVVNQGQALLRGTPMARGRMRPMSKFLSHITITLGYAGEQEKTNKKAAPKAAATETPAPKAAPKKRAAPKKTATPSA